MRDRIKFYGPNDLSVGHYIDRVERILEEYSNENSRILNFIDAIELWNALKFLEAQVYSKNWKADFVNSLTSIIRGKVYKFFNTVPKASIIEYMLTLQNEFQYREDFFEIFVKFKYAEKISEKQFCDAFYKTGISVRYLLEYTYFNKVYPSAIKELFLSKAEHLEILLENYSDKNNLKYFLPENISSQEWNNLLFRYIHSDNLNINYLRMLQNPIKSMGNEYFSLSSEIRLEIQKRIEFYYQKIDKSQAGLEIIFEVYRDKKNYEEKTKEYNEIMGGSSHIELIEKNIIQNLLQVDSHLPQTDVIYFTTLVDYEQIKQNHELDNLFYSIISDKDIFSESRKLLLPSFPNKESSEILNSIGMTTKGSYPDTGYFKLKNKLVLLKLKVYQDTLQEVNINVEMIVKWYFQNFILNSYNIEWLSINFSPNNDAIENKIGTIFRVEESIRKQYLLLIERGHIDRELYNLMDTPRIDSLPSVIPKKYVYLSNNDTFKNLLFLLFNDQSHLTCVDVERCASNFIDLITKYQVSKKDFFEFEQEKIDFLLNNKIISCLDDVLVVSNPTKIKVLQELYWYGEISYYNLTNDEKTEIDNLKKRGWIDYKSTLFSRSEINYLNYLLNNSKFENSLGIRNKYQHGAPVYEYVEEYQKDYMVALLVLLIYLAKTNEEFNYKKKVM
ncbi:hypothetical protein KJR28_01930 [Streptococcus lutetiensis]|uniref:hypothetical protein n=1 Tax=Streptococcus lutetiensis TaxID=150055 RepID=UPI001BD98360|nr:hypothetical protein [Streptococcus lutetiensis]MBT0897959.1 hypothetical protein [Streptococcus lutetiensis]MBT0902964.1 hypothetical protein [Streptococcus lutetiensis]MBT0922496.1 hypothetical protein [Streptococcus lutetiensis]MBT0928133.1 hypothetical protein [Streptococcus lutetiensis]MBT0943276.1 hypothetical protein [Streptococcus lutetiensis]